MQEKLKEKKPGRSNLSKLTEETIRARTKTGDTPLHRAARNGQFDLISPHLLTIELFMKKNVNGDTPLHLAARFGTLNQVPRQFLTKETLTMTTSPRHAPNGFYFTGSGYEARTETVLHAAANSRHADQIPKEFLTPEFLLVEATGYKQTVLEQIINSEIDVLPKDYASLESWNVKNKDGQTPRQILEILIDRKAQLESDRKVWQAARQSFVAQVRSEPPTEKQIEKLRWFGYNTDGITTKGQASDMLDKCVRENPEKDSAYYNRFPTEGQLEKLRELNEESIRIDGEPAYDLETLTYGEAKDIIQQDEWARRKEAEEVEMNKFSNPPSKAQLEWLKESGIKLDPSAKVSEWELEYIIGLEKLPPSEEDLSLFRQHGVISFKGDGFGAYLFADLIRSFGGSAQDHNRAKINYGPPCQAALRDPAYHTPTLTYNDGEHAVEFTWPKNKIREWLRA